jgi:thiol:disulfide interchange protein DsbA
MSSFGIRSQVAKNDKIARGVRSVPTIIINEKYQAIFTRDMTPDQSVELISWLVKQK